MSFQDGVVSVVSMDRMAAVVAACKIRSENIPCDVFYTGNIKKQMQKSADFEAVVLILEDGTYVKDMITGIQRPLEGDLVKAVMHVLYEGYYDDSVQDSQ